MSKTPTTFFWLFDTFTVAFGPLNEAPLHTHPIAQITLGIEAPLRIHGAAGPIDAWAVFIPPGALHRSLAGASFTDAAHAAGFADSAHLARTFRQVFGDSISGRLLDPHGSRFIQAVRCRDS